MSERRTAIRVPVDLSATIVSEDGVERIVVKVVNLSRQGAGIMLAAAEKLPACFYVLFPDHRIQPCALAWRDEQGAGLRFCS